MSDTIGMMEGAYFVSRTELLKWLNESFGLNYNKVEQCCTAAAHCQVIDSIYPGSVDMAKVSWDAKSEYQYVNNFKVLQKAFDRNGIKRHIDVERLVKGKYQDNLEFLQWIKAYFDMKKGSVDAEYDPHARRGVSASASSANATSASAGGRRVAPTRGVAAGRGSGLKTRDPPTRQPPVASAADQKKMQSLEQQVEQLELQSSEDQLNIENLIKERDFYFKKLRDIEILVQNVPEPKPDHALDITEILYATEDGFEGPEGEEAQ